jgi:hypothetical protein
MWRIRFTDYSKQSWDRPLELFLKGLLLSKNCVEICISTNRVYVDGHSCGNCDGTIGFVYIICICTDRVDCELRLCVKFDSAFDYPYIHRSCILRATRWSKYYEVPLHVNWHITSLVIEIEC